MDLGDIFFIFVFIIIIVSNVYKQMKKTRLKSSGGEIPVKKPGWKGALEIILEEARKQMENQAKKEPAGAPSGPTGWEGILSKPAPDANPSEEPMRRDKTGPEIVKSEKAKSEKSGAERAAAMKAQAMAQRPLRFREKQSLTTERAPDVLKKGTVKPGQAAVPKDYYAAAIDNEIPPKLSQEALRNAVVWAEILAPPVGLRGME